MPVKHGFRLFRIVLTFGLLSFVCPQKVCGQASTPADTSDVAAFIKSDTLSGAAKLFATVYWKPNTALDFAEVPETVITAFVQQATGLMYNDYSLLICAKRAMKLPNGQSALIAVVRDNGRFCGLLVVVERVADAFRVSSLSVWQMSTLDDIISVRAGAITFSVPEIWSDYEGTQACTATYFRVYRFLAGRFQDISQSSQLAFSKERRRLSERLSALGAANVESDCLSMEIARIDRILNAGDISELTLGHHWSVDYDYLRRLKAVAIFSDIGGNSAREALQGLAGDANPLVAKAAAQALTLSQ